MYDPHTGPPQIYEKMAGYNGTGTEETKGRGFDNIESWFVNHFRIRSLGRLSSPEVGWSIFEMHIYIARCKGAHLRWFGAYLYSALQGSAFVMNDAE